jgi:hypothetical protein
MVKNQFQNKKINSCATKILSLKNENLAGVLEKK